MKKTSIIAAVALSAMAGEAAFDPIVPFSTLDLSQEENVRQIRKIREATGLRRFFVTGPGFNGVMYGPFADDTYAKIGLRIVEMRKLLSGTDIELSWWCSPSIRYFSDFSPIEDSHGHRSKDNKKCPLDPAFAADWCAKIRDVAAAHPPIICIEDDYTLAWGRGLGGSGACFCPRHLALFAKIYGKPLPAAEIEAAFRNRTAENLPVRKAFAATVRESLVGLARQVRQAVDEVDPSIRICLCDTGGCSDKDGDALEPLVRAFAGKTRPAVRPHGSIYGAETTPAAIPPAVAHTQYVLERLPRDIETLYESDPYPHNRFYTSASQLLSLMAGAVTMGAQDFLFYCLQYLDDPFEDPGYANGYLAMKPRLEAAKDFIAARQARLEGVRVWYSADHAALTRDVGENVGGQLQCGAYLCSKMSLPYTTRKDAKGPVLLVGSMPETMSDEEIRSVLSGGVLIDAVAADLLTKRGFGELLGTDVKLFESRPPIVGERILPAAGNKRPGKLVNAFYILFAGTEGTVKTFAKLVPRPDTEVWCEFTGTQKELITPSLTFAKNALGGRVAVLATSLVGNRSSGLFNFRKQELLRNLFLRLEPASLPVSAIGVPGIWTLANVSADGREMLVMLNNLSGDVRDGVELAFEGKWADATVERLGEDGKPTSLGRAAARWTVPFPLGQMMPEYLLLKYE